MASADLFSKLVLATGLPVEIVAPRLESWLINQGLTPDNLTMEQFRNFLAEFLQDLILQERE